MYSDHVQYGYNYDYYTAQSGIMWKGKDNV